MTERRQLLLGDSVIFQKGVAKVVAQSVRDATKE